MEERVPEPIGGSRGRRKGWALIVDGEVHPIYGLPWVDPRRVARWEEEFGSGESGFTSEPYPLQPETAIQPVPSLEAVTSLRRVDRARSDLRVGFEVVALRVRSQVRRALAAHYGDPEKGA